MKERYLLRLDDASPYMDKERWEKMEAMLDKHHIKPLVGIIPNNEDKHTILDEEDTLFWSHALQWIEKGWKVALHGYNHVMTSDQGMRGMNPMWERSEFAGLSLDEQKDKIRKGVAVFRKNRIEPKYFFAPSHTFDTNTLLALHDESNIRVICDTIAFRPYKKDDFVFIPQIVGHCMKMYIPGVYTFCFHPNSMKDREFERLESFLSRYGEHFISFDQILIDSLKTMKLSDHCLRTCFFLYRRLRGLR